MNPRDGSVIAVALVLAPLAKTVEFVAAPAVGGPDILAGLAVCVGWLCDLWYALPAGFVLGLIEDVVTARCLGSRAIALALAALLAAVIKSVLNPDSLSSKMLAALSGMTLADFVTWGVLASRGIRIAAPYFLRSIWIPSALWSLALIGPLHFAVKRMALGAANVWPSSGRKGREAAL